MMLKKIYQLYFLAILAAFYSGLCFAEEEKEKTPLLIEGAPKVNAKQVIDLANKYSKLIIVDSRIAGDRQKGYIESSISLPNTKTNCNSLARVLPSKKTEALFYCNGVNCGRSAKAIKIALKCGYKNLYWFRGGFEVWLQEGLPYMKD